MIFFIGFLSGIVISGIFFLLWYLLLQSTSSKKGHEILEKVGQFVPTISRRPQKKIPVWISEEEQWKKEQKQPPLDPEFR